jgi:hypothetical protein
VLQEPTGWGSERLPQAEHDDAEEVLKGMKHLETAQVPRGACVYDMDHLVPDATAGLSPYPGACSLPKSPRPLRSGCGIGDDGHQAWHYEPSASGQSSVGVDMGCMRSASHSDVTAVEPIAERDGFSSDEHDVQSARCARLASRGNPDASCTSTGPSESLRIMTDLPPASGQRWPGPAL